MNENATDTRMRGERARLDADVRQQMLGLREAAQVLREHADTMGAVKQRETVEQVARQCSRWADTLTRKLRS